MKRLRREQAENERIRCDESVRVEQEKNIDDIANEYGKLKRQRRIQRFQVSNSYCYFVDIDENLFTLTKNK